MTDHQCHIHYHSYSQLAMDDSDNDNYWRLHNSLMIIVGHNIDTRSIFIYPTLAIVIVSQ